MTFADLPDGAGVFLDANVLVYHFQPHPIHGAACTALLKRIELHELTGFSSTHVLGEFAHRLMTLEASVAFGWPSKIVQRLKQNPAQVQTLVKFRQSLQQIPKFGIQILTIPPHLVDIAAAMSQQTGLLTNDALVVAVMQANGLTNLASSDADFDGVAGITRYAPA
jgi:predicted nucleic acid-binding protein